MHHRTSQRARKRTRFPSGQAPSSEKQGHQQVKSRKTEPTMMHIGQFWLQFRKALLYERISTIKTMSGRPLRGRRGHRGTGSRRFGAGSRRGDVQEGRGDRVGRPKGGSVRQDARGLPAAARHQRSAHNWPRTPQSPVFAKQPTKEGPGPKRFPGVFTSCISLSFVHEARSGFYRALLSGAWRNGGHLAQSA